MRPYVTHGEDGASAHARRPCCLFAKPGATPKDEVPTKRKSARGKSAAGWDFDATYAGKDPIDPRPILHTRINGGQASPARWDPVSNGYVGTDRMRHSDDKGGVADTGIVSNVR